MRTKITILLLMVAFAFTASAQSIGDFIDVVHLKNGTVVKGIIVEQVPGQSVRIQTQDGKAYTYSIYDIAKFTREAKMTTSTADNNSGTAEVKTCAKEKASCKDKAACASKGKSCCAKEKSCGENFKKKEKGYFAEIGVLGNSSAYAFRVTNGYKFGQFGYLGLALGLENVQLKYGERIPEISLNLVYAGDILKTKVTPFYQLEAGYGFSLDRYGYNRDILNVNNFDFGRGHGKWDKEDFDDNSSSRLNYGGPQGALAFGVKINTKKKIYYKIALDARVTSNFSDVHYDTFDGLGAVTGSEMKEVFSANPGLGARFSIGF